MCGEGNCQSGVLGSISFVGYPTTCGSVWHAGDDWGEGLHTRVRLSSSSPSSVGERRRFLTGNSSVGKGGNRLRLTTFSLHANTASSRLLGDGSKSKASGLLGSILALGLTLCSMWSMVSGG